MDNNTLKALKGSIQKWHNIAYHNGTDKGSLDCPLCILFPSSDCCGCPISEKTGVEHCEFTPYEDYRCASEPKKEAIIFLKWLVLLLPEGESAKMKDGWVWYWKWL